MSSDLLPLLAAGVGVVLVLAALRDVFHTLFHPSDSGAICPRLCAGTWWMARRLGRQAGSRPRQLAGPLAVVGTMGAWVAMLIVGYALIYLPLSPDQLARGDGTGQAGPFLDALYLSITALSTLGLGDVVITPSPMRLLAPAEALTGFVVLTVAIAWVGQIYPALARRRSLALQVGAFWEAHGEESVGESVLASTARSWTPAASGVVVDLIQNFETYYFHESDRRLSLGTLVVGLDRCVNLLDSHTNEESQAVGRGLGRVLDHLFATLHEQYGVPVERAAALEHLAPL
ncbi:hypothetical protein GCM10027020_32810 [Nocardioides salsibiostraticola]